MKLRAHYMPAFEVLNAILIGIAAFIGGIYLLWLGYGLYKVLTSFELQSSNALTPAFASLLYGLAMSLVVAVVWFVVILLVSLLQYLLLAAPIAHFASKGLDEDARRSLAFYVLSGAVIGGGPWWMLTYFLFDRHVDWASLLMFLVPGLSVGLLAGAALKVRLVRLAAVPSIENSIK
jgi:hypothetical protein